MDPRSRSTASMLLVLLIAASALLPLRAQSGVQERNGIPMSGREVAALSNFDEAITSFMSRSGISAGALAIASGSQVVFQRGYGWTSNSKTAYLRPDAMFRLASITKPITKAAIRQLVAAARLSLSDKAICVGSNQPCRLSITPYRTPDSRLGTITVGQLLDHTGGWDREITPDLTYQSFTVARDLGIGMPPSREDTVRWILGQRLDFNPGARFAYSNVGYLLLGLIVEQASGVPWFDYVRQNIFSPVGVADGDVIVARSLAQDRDRREPAYEDPYMAASVFPPNALVPEPDGGFYLEARIGVGNVVTTSRVMALFLTKYLVSGMPRTLSVPSDWHTGAYAGTNTLARQYTNGVGLVFLFDRLTSPSGRDIDSEGFRELLDSLVSQSSWGTLPSMPAPDSTPLPTPPASSGPGRAGLRMTINPSSPVPYSGQSISGCSNGTWFYEHVLEETSGVALTLLERVQIFDGRESSRTAMSTAMAGGGRVTYNFQWCSSPTASHTVQTNFSVRDGNGNTFTATGPVVQLRPR